MPTEPASRALSPICGFPPIAVTGASILILGSMPGRASLQAGQYYAHPRNCFWRILETVLGTGRAGTYAARTDMLRQSAIALWDVLATCRREGSLDSDIQPDTLQANDFRAFFRTHPAVRVIVFNGATAHTLFARHVMPTLTSTSTAATLPRIRLPSTSPANASIGYERKLEAWRAALAGNPADRPPPIEPARSRSARFRLA